MAVQFAVPADQLVAMFLRLYPTEVARTLDGHPLQDITAILQKARAVDAAAVIERLTPEVASGVLAQMDAAAFARIVPVLDPVRAAAVLARLDPDVIRDRLRLLDAGTMRELHGLMTYPEESAGRLMDPRVAAFYPETPVREALRRLRRQRRPRVHDAFVVDPDGRLVGAVPLEAVAIAEPGERLAALAGARPFSVLAVAHRQEVIEEMTQRKLVSLPVTDVEGRLLGVIRHDSLVAATQEEASADIQTMVGASKEERALSHVSFAVRKRLPWLQVNLATAFLAAAVVGIFESTIARFTALAVLLPVVAGQSGNTGSQALAVTMRGLALREIRLRHWPRVSAKEVNVGLINGLAVAVVTVAGVLLWSRSLGLALVIGLAMIVSMAAAGLAGASIPMLLTAIGQDPAQSSSIILTTITDVVGFLSFLGLATLFAARL